MLIGTIIGLVSSFIPELIKIYREKLEHKQELERLEFELKHQKELAQIRIEEAKALAQIELDKAVYQYTGTTPITLTGSKFIDIIQVLMNAYNQSVRPTITYLIITMWLILKYAMWQKAGGTLEAIPQIWGQYETDFIATIITFWFGGRLMQRTFGRV